MYFINHFSDSLHKPVTVKVDSSCALKPFNFGLLLQGMGHDFMPVPTWVSIRLRDSVGRVANVQAVNAKVVQVVQSALN